MMGTYYFLCFSPSFGSRYSIHIRKNKNENTMTKDVPNLAGIQLLSYKSGKRILSHHANY